MENGKNSFSKKARRKKQKRWVEKRRRGNIKKSIDELALLIPEARKQFECHACGLVRCSNVSIKDGLRIAHGQRLQQSKILQLVVDYVQSSLQGNDGFRQLSNDRAIPDNNSDEYGCSCTYCQQQFDQCTGDIATFSPNLDPNLQSPLYSQHNRHLCDPRADFQHPQSDQSVYSISLHEQSPFEEGVSMSFFKSHRHWSSNSNMASIEVDRDDVAMETSGGPPLRALKSLCCSISSDIIPAVSTPRDALSRETYPSCTRNSDQFVLDSVFQRARSCRLIPQTPPPSSYELSPLQVPESHRLWRPWIV